MGMADPHDLERPAARWALISGFVTLVGLLNFAIVVTSKLSERGSIKWRYPFVWEMTGAYTVLLLLPALLWFMPRFPIERSRFFRRLGQHLLFMVAFGIAHTLLMWGSREALYALLGWGWYDYGDMRYRFFMEGQKQAVVYWLVYSVVAVTAALRRSRERELLASRLEKELTEARLQALKMQLNPHFLFNTLNMISSYVHADPNVADAMLGHLSDFLRLTLRLSGVQEVPLGKELEFLHAYLAITKARFEDRLTVEVDVPGEAREALVPHLVLQPLVENAVTHTTAGPSGRGHIRVAAAREGDRVRLVVEDDGPGLNGDVETAMKGGIGLTNTVERLRNLYGAEHRFELSSPRGGGFKVTLEVPYRTASEAPAS